MKMFDDFFIAAKIYGLCSVGFRPDASGISLLPHAHLLVGEMPKCFGLYHCSIQEKL